MSLIKKNMLNNPLSDSFSEQNKLKPSFLKIKGKTLVFSNTIYQIKNITSIEFITFKTTAQYKKYKNKFSIYLFYILIFGLIVSMFAKSSLFVFFLIALGVLILFTKNKFITKTIDNYGIKIITNNGTEKILVSNSEFFIKQIILYINDAMNNSEPRYLNFNFETLNMSEDKYLKLDMSEDKSISIKENNNSPIVSGKMEGDIVNFI
ncbi:DUF6232 family protein [Moorena sp. SIO3I6]|uniref:DUF6232 family protein n=1 Tax=Moorena sp. SIO3I6 TaxID=2607831 RepID=UPI0013FBA875|nr:DUF6232 family protein [Moorena sp. SIO3I6]NEP27816.1 hypothetical protein [Moorena sp. SIO3I6]